MKKQLVLKLSIPKPCHEDWEAMTPNEKGRHCASCNKTVVDFTQYSDRALIDFFSKVKGEVCGRMTSWQMGREIIYTEPSRFAFLYRFLFGTAMTLGLAGSANGNYNPFQLPKMEQPQPGKKPAQHKPLHSVPTHYITGVVRDDKTNEALSGVRIAFMYNGRVIGMVKSDTNGHYKYHINGIYLHKEITIVRAYTYMNYGDFSQTVILDQLPYHYDINLSIRQQVTITANSTPRVECVYHAGGTISRVDYVRIAVKDVYTPDVIDVNHPDVYTIRKGDTPYW